MTLWGISGHHRHLCSDLGWRRRPGSRCGPCTGAMEPIVWVGSFPWFPDKVGVVHKPTRVLLHTLALRLQFQFPLKGAVPLGAVTHPGEGRDLTQPLF